MQNQGGKGGLICKYTSGAAGEIAPHKTAIDTQNITKKW